jgi:hypothetical protein
MSSLIPGILIIATFLAASVIMFGTFLSTSTTQSESLRELGRINRERAGSIIVVSDASITLSVAGVSTDMTILVDNIGSQPVGSFSRMDVIVQYTDSSDNEVGRYLSYDPASVGNNQWTIPNGGIDPDILNPGMWDPDETLTLELRIAPDMKVDTAAVVTIATPRGASAQTTVSN